MTKIAIIEDDAMIAQMYQMKFEFSGFNTMLARTGEDALEMISKSTPDLILLDIILPKMSGFDFLEKIRSNKKFEKIPVILLTNAEKSNFEPKLKKLRISDFIVKSQLTPNQVVEKVTEALKSTEL